MRIIQSHTKFESLVCNIYSSGEKRGPKHENDSMETTICSSHDQSIQAYICGSNWRWQPLPSAQGGQDSF